MDHSTLVSALVDTLHLLPEVNLHSQIWGNGPYCSICPNPDPVSGSFIEQVCVEGIRFGFRLEAGRNLNIHYSTM